MARWYSRLPKFVCGTIRPILNCCDWSSFSVCLESVAVVVDLCSCTRCLSLSRPIRFGPPIDMPDDSDVFERQPLTVRKVNAAVITKIKHAVRVAVFMLLPLACVRACVSVLFHTTQQRCDFFLVWKGKGDAHNAHTTASTANSISTLVGLFVLQHPLYVFIIWKTTFHFWTISSKTRFFPIHLAFYFAYKWTH